MTEDSFKPRAGTEHHGPPPLHLGLLVVGQIEPRVAIPVVAGLDHLVGDDQLVPVIRHHAAGHACVPSDRQGPEEVNRLTHWCFLHDVLSWSAICRVLAMPARSRNAEAKSSSSLDSRSAARARDTSGWVADNTL